MTNLTVALLDVEARGYPRECLGALLRAPACRGAELFFVTRADRANETDVNKAREVFAGVKTLTVPESGDEAAARNAALAQASADSVLLVTSVTMVTPACPARLQEILAEHPRAAAVGALLLRENGWPKQSWFESPALRRQLGRPIRFIEGLNPRAWRYGSARFESRPLRRVEAVRSACVLLRKEGWRNVGEFSAGYRFGFDDVEWGVRARKAGWRLLVAADARAFHVPPQEARPLPIEVYLAYEAALRRCLRRTRGGAYRAAFEALRTARSARLALAAGAASLALLGRSRMLRWRAKVHRNILRWRLAGHPPVSAPADAESTLRWENTLL